MARAIEEGRRATEIYPRNVAQRNNVAAYLMYAGNFEAAARESRAVLELNPSYPKAYSVLALSELAQGHAEQAAEIYRRQEAVSARGASFAATGLADLALYEGRLADAAALLENAVAADLARKDTSAALEKLAMLSDTELLRGRKAAALVAADRAMAASKQEKVQLAAAQVYIEAGQEAKARAIASRMGSRLEPEVEAYGKLVQSWLEIRRGNMREAIRLLQNALQLTDTWIGHFWLGRAYLDAGAFTEAYTEFERCLKRRGEATAIFLDELPTYRFLPPVHYYLGRAQDGLKSDGGTDSYRTFLAIKTKAEEQSLIVDARRRLSIRPR
jgi:tetratricopeptide (TPR) repeat protein